MKKVKLNKEKSNFKLLSGAFYIGLLISSKNVYCMSNNSKDNGGSISNREDSNENFTIVHISNNDIHQSINVNLLNEHNNTEQENNTNNQTSINLQTQSLINISNRNENSIPSEINYNNHSKFFEAHSQLNYLNSNNGSSQKNPRTEEIFNKTRSSINSLGDVSSNTVNEQVVNSSSISGFGNISNSKDEVSIPSEINYKNHSKFFKDLNSNIPLNDSNGNITTINEQDCSSVSNNNLICQHIETDNVFRGSDELTKLNNGYEIVVGWNQDLSLIPEIIDTKGNRYRRIIYTLGTQNNPNANAGSHYVAAEVFTSHGRTIVIHRDSLNQILNQEFVDYIRERISSEAIIVDINSDSLIQTNRFNCGPLALGNLNNSNGIVNIVRRQILELKDLDRLNEIDNIKSFDLSDKQSNHDLNVYLANNLMSKYEYSENQQQSNDINQTQIHLSSPNNSDSNPRQTNIIEEPKIKNLLQNNYHSQTMIYTGSDINKRHFDDNEQSQSFNISSILYYEDKKSSNLQTPTHRARSKSGLEDNSFRNEIDCKILVQNSSISTISINHEDNNNNSIGKNSGLENSISKNIKDNNHNNIDYVSNIEKGNPFEQEPIIDLSNNIGNIQTVNNTQNESNEVHSISSLYDKLKIQNSNLECETDIKDYKMKQLEIIIEDQKYKDLDKLLSNLSAERYKRESELMKKYNWTPLMVMARLGKVNYAKDFINKYKKDIGKQDISGRTALMIAAQNDCYEIVKLFIDNKIEVGMQGNNKKKGKYKWTAMMFAAERGNTRCVELLKPYEKNMQENDNWTALMYGVKNNHDDIVEILYDSELDQNNIEDQTALIVALKFGNRSYNTIELLSKKQIKKFDKYNKTALMYAASSGNSKFINLLKEEIGMTDNRKWTALMYAAANGNLEIVKILSETSELGMKNCLERTALMLAAMYRQEECVKFLSSENKEARITDDEGRTALMLAIEKGYDNITNILIESEYGIKNDEGNTALMLAVKNRRNGLIEKLYEKESGIRDDNGLTALMIAAKVGNKEAVEILSKTELNMKKDNIIEDIENDSIDDSSNDNGWNALMYAIVYGNLDIVEYLAKTNELNDKNKEVILSMAEKKGNEYVKALKESGKYNINENFFKKLTLNIRSSNKDLLRNLYSNYLDTNNIGNSINFSNIVLNINMSEFYRALKNLIDSFLSRNGNNDNINANNTESTNKEESNNSNTEGNNNAEVEVNNISEISLQINSVEETENDIDDVDDNDNEEEVEEDKSISGQIDNNGNNPDCSDYSISAIQK